MRDTYPLHRDRNFPCILHIPKKKKKKKKKKKNALLCSNMIFKKKTHTPSLGKGRKKGGRDRVVCRCVFVMFLYSLFSLFLCLCLFSFLDP